jgi:hypothetical protein
MLGNIERVEVIVTRRGELGEEVLLSKDGSFIGRDVSPSDNLELENAAFRMCLDLAGVVVEDVKVLESYYYARLNPTAPVVGAAGRFTHLVRAKWLRDNRNFLNSAIDATMFQWEPVSKAVHSATSNLSDNDCGFRRRALIQLFADGIPA